MTINADPLLLDVVVGEHGAWDATPPCSGKPELFFEGEREQRRRRLKREAEARTYCAQCPLREACRDRGRANRESGIWGGENDEERALAGFAPRAIQRRSVAEARLIGLARAVKSEASGVLDDGIA